MHQEWKKKLNATENDKLVFILVLHIKSKSGMMFSCRLVFNHLYEQLAVPTYSTYYMIVCLFANRRAS